ncbi:hypothetical protein X770_05820 [Mesorhizobium sp. LSJC269B00]|nr:hypothetical protein X770_05820 [Mesorhizobium sp. LSJC269B00]
MRHRVDADVAANLVGPLADVGDMLAGIAHFRKGREQIIASGGGEIPARATESSVHGHRAWNLQARRPAHRLLEAIVGAFIVQRLVRGVELFQDFDPFGGLVVALLDQRRAEHAEFLRVPAADDVQAGAALADMVDSCQRLGGIERMHQRHMHGHEQADLLGGHRQSCCPGEGLERPFAHLVAAAKATPARDRKHKFQPGAVGDLRRRQIVLPACRPAFRHIGDGQTAIGIGRKDAELQFVRAVQGMRFDHHGNSWRETDTLGPRKNISSLK